MADDEDIAFGEIAVVARSLEDYGARIQEIFQSHGIPIAGRLAEPLAQFPLTKAVILLLTLPAKDFPRGQVIDFLSSPYLQANALLQTDIQARPDLWDLATRELAICKGLSEWRRLRKFTDGDLELGQGFDPEERRVMRIPPVQLTYLADLVENLAADLSKLPERGSWSLFASDWKELLKKYLGIAPANPRKAPAGAEAVISETILNLLHQLGELRSVRGDVALGDFSDTFQHWLEVFDDLSRPAQRRWRSGAECCWRPWSRLSRAFPPWHERRGLSTNHPRGRVPARPRPGNPRARSRLQDQPETCGL